MFGVTCPREAALISACVRRPDAMPFVNLVQYTLGADDTDVFAIFAIP